MKRIARWFLLLSLASAPAYSEPPAFDYYLLSLSWSPEFCKTHSKEQQCSLGYGAVLHGLWPQYQQGYPQFCDSRPLPEDLVKKYADLYPSDDLIVHEWERHGTCSGVPAADYLKLSAGLKQRFKTPPALQNLNQPLRASVREFTRMIIDANPGLSEDSVALSCSGGRDRFLQEIYLCYDNNAAKPVACAEDVQHKSRKSCGQKALLVRNIR